MTNVPYLLEQMAYAGQRRGSVNPLLRAFYDHLLAVAKALDVLEDGQDVAPEEQTAILRAALPVGAELAAAVAIAEDAQKGLAAALAAARGAPPVEAPSTPPGEATGLRNFWVRWVAPGTGPITLGAPWWRGGYETTETETSRGLRKESFPIFFAAVRAQDKAGAERVIRNGVYGDAIVFEFVKEQPSDWSPFCERFPREVWMEWPEMPQPQPGDRVHVAEPPGHALTLQAEQARVGPALEPKGRLNRLIEALAIFARCSNGNAQTHCEQEILWVMRVKQEDVPPKDQDALADRGFFWAYDEECWCSSEHGSA